MARVELLLSCVCMNVSVASKKEDEKDERHGSVSNIIDGDGEKWSS